MMVPARAASMQVLQDHNELSYLQLLCVQTKLTDNVSASTAGNEAAVGFACLVDKYTANVAVVAPDASDGH
jgi:hypothetical protein